MTVSVVVLVISALFITAQGTLEECSVKARTTAGWLCGCSRYDFKGGVYASFQNVPYAQQPLGELRFKELQPPKHWNGLYNATTEGPICPQIDVVYGRLMTNKNMSEACIHANIYVPIYALPTNPYNWMRPALPVFVFFHGGAFEAGSGETDLHGPEYLVTENIIVITFNYRNNVFGYLSLNSPSIPGNTGLRDAVTLLHWVQDNAKFFGGDPNDVTIGGHSTGGAIAHLMVLSKATEGLLKRAILMSGVATRSFYTASPKYAKEVANLFLSTLAINETDPEKIHNQLIDMPLEKIMAATAVVQAAYHPIAFCPVVEQQFPGVTTVIDEDPETLLLHGQGNHIPLIIGFTNWEGALFYQNAVKFNVLGAVETNPVRILSPHLIYKLSNTTAIRFAEKTVHRYFNGVPTVEKYLKSFGDYAFVYPAIKLAETRAATGGAPVFLYQFAYNPDFSAIKVAKEVEYKGAAHAEDIQFIFRTNSMKGYTKFEYPSRRDQIMREYMLKMVRYFITCNDPTCSMIPSRWPPQHWGAPVRYQNIVDPRTIFYTDLTAEQKDMVRYLDQLYNEAINV